MLSPVGGIVGSGAFGRAEILEKVSEPIPLAAQASPKRGHPLSVQPSQLTVQLVRENLRETRALF